MNIDTLVRFTPLAYGVQVLSVVAFVDGISELLVASAVVSGTVGATLLAIIPTFDSTLEAHKPQVAKAGLSQLGIACAMVARLLFI
ncbi:hypothetical protein ABT093_40860 [Kitasatospora sp. NPDC002551]|uniref:hypothetical protein n=1 Tax=Kitasatospora sp. NPDC002551 TaxID=3154539 RepID=UPI003331AE67